MLSDGNILPGFGHCEAGSQANWQRIKEALKTSRHVVVLPSILRSTMPLWHLCTSALLLYSPSVPELSLWHLVLSALPAMPAISLPHKCGEEGHQSKDRGGARTGQVNVCLVFHLHDLLYIMMMLQEHHSSDYIASCYCKRRRFWKIYWVLYEQICN